MSTLTQSSGTGAQVDPVQLGSLLFTMVEPRRGHEVEYNRWYERDHFYAGCMTGEYQFAGDRFVATAPYKALRYPTESSMCPDPASGSYLAIYWVLAGHHDEWNQWAVERVNALHQAGRMFEERDHIHTALYEYAWSHRADEWGTSAELALDRNYDGIVVNVGDVAEGHTHAEVEEWIRTTWASRAFGSSWGPDLIVNATPLPLSDDAPPDVPRVPNADRRFLQIHFCDQDPADDWEEGYGRFGEALEASGFATHVWTSPFIQTVFGTDTYTDQLW